MEQDTWCLPCLLTQCLISSGTLTHPIKPIMTTRVILAPFSHLDTALLLALPTNTKYHLKAQQKARSLVYMINQATSFGQDISLKLKDIPYPVTLSIKITWVPFRLLKTDMCQAPSAPNTSRQNISSSTIITMHKSLNFDTVPLNKCGQMFWLSLSKDLNFDRCVHSSWIALSIMLKTFNFYRPTTLRWILLTVLHQRAPFLILHRLGHSLPLFFRWNLKSHWSHLHRRGVLRHPYYFLPVLNQ